MQGRGYAECPATPLLIIGSLTVFMTLESVFPYFKHGAGRRRQRWHNVGMIGVAALVNAVIGTFGSVADRVVGDHELRPAVPRRRATRWLTIVLGIFLVDLL